MISRPNVVELVGLKPVSQGNGQRGSRCFRNVQKNQSFLITHGSHVRQPVLGKKKIPFLLLGRSKHKSAGIVSAGNNEIIGITTPYATFCFLNRRCRELQPSMISDQNFSFASWLACIGSGQDIAPTRSLAKTRQPHAIASTAMRPKA